MKILKIRGCNLASLAGEFEVDLVGEKLGTVGLFAITGPTGSGKSTLLDAMCLALFDTTPRMETIGRPLSVGPVGSEEADRLAENDCRGLLTRGKASGWAEVVFRARDGRVYSSTWRVRRARDRARGRLQTSEMVLVDVATGAPWGRTKTEILERIRGLVGLSFDQFRRSVLLAQGEFAAFLKAREDERAALLEQVTGTQLYAKISRCIYAHYEQEKTRRLVLETSMGDVKTLTENERNDIQRELDQVLYRKTQLQERASLLSSYSVWYERQAELIREIRKGQEALEVARVEHEAAVEERKSLERVTLLRSAGARLVEVERLRRECADLSSELAVMRHRGAEAAALFMAAESEEREFVQRMEKEESGFRVLESDLKEARRVDEVVAGLVRRLEELGAESGEQRTQLLSAEVRLSEVTEAAGRLLAEADKLEEWIDINRHAQAVYEARDDIFEVIDRLASADAELTVCSQQLDEIGEREKTSAKKQDQYRNKITTCEEALRNLDVSIGELSPMKQNLNKTDLWEQRSLNERRRSWLKKLTETLELVHLQATENTQCLLDIETCNLNKTQLQQLLVSYTSIIQTLDTEVEKARDELQEAERIVSLEDRRGFLRDGLPCPLCGSTEHPWKTSPLEDHLLDRLKTRVKDLAGRLGEVRREEAETSHQLKGLEVRRDELRRRLSVGETRKEHLESEFIAMLGDNGDWVRAMDSGALGVGSEWSGWSRLFAAMSRRIEDQEKSIRDQLKELDWLEASLLKLSQEKVEIELLLREMNRKLLENFEENSRVVQSRNELESKKASLLAERTLLRGRLQALAGPLFDGRILPEDVSTGIKQVISDVIELWSIKTLDLSLKRQELIAVQQEGFLCESRLSDLRSRVARDGDRMMVLEGELQAQERVRKGMLGGRKTDDVEAEARSSLESARNELVKCQTKRAGLRVLMETNRELVERETRRLEKAQEELAAAGRELGVELGMLEASESEVVDAMAKDEGILSQRRKRLEDLANGLARWQVVVDERVRGQKQHEEAGSPDLGEEELRGELALVNSGLAGLGEQEMGIRVRVRQDEEARQAYGKLIDEWEAQKLVEADWCRLNDLVGSANGDKFRKIAQGLTLELLVAHANEHLRVLASRYKVQRVPFADLGLQIVDCDMGDEVRSINTLSGGESFLVSLALALGLASLASDSTWIESLFIDEGFGTLDTDSLNTAINVLYGLQSSGRQVGIISHVPGLARQLRAEVAVERVASGYSRVVVR